MLPKVLKGVERFIELCSNIGVLGIIAALLMGLSDITSRLIGRTFEGGTEYTELFLAAIAFMSLGYAQISGRHVRVDSLVRNFPSKVKAIMNICILLFLGGWVTILTMQNAMELERAWVMKLIHPTTGSMIMLALWPSYFFAVTGCIILIIAYAVQIVKNIIALKTNSSPGDYL